MYLIEQDLLSACVQMKIMLIICIYTVFENKDTNSRQYLTQILTDFQDSFTIRYISRFIVKW